MGSDSAPVLGMGLAARSGAMTRGANGTNPWVILGLVMVGTFMTTLDTSIVNISLPTIARAFGTPLNGAIEWVLIIYLVVIAALLLTFGRLSDAIGLNAVAVSFGVAAGPSLGGIITEHLSWRWIFFINVPIGLVGALAAARLLPQAKGRPQSFDVAGAVLLGIGLGLLT